ncbi:MAG: hypothetical protein IE886_09030, partial [Campylobacterales bacterium]|nr:hypothetical protein [Campylobacterales bacterium]
MLASADTFEIEIFGKSAHGARPHEGVAQLIYKSYHCTYYKSQFYDPVKIRQLNEDREVVSIVAVYGEALMLHPFSQKANLSHGMCETAIVLGELPSQTEIERQIRASLRSGAMINFLVFDTHKRYRFLSGRYAEQIEATYRCARVEASVSHPANSNRQLLTHHFNPHINVGFIIIEGLPDPEALDEPIDLMHTDHCEMVYADLNLHHIEEIDEVVAMLNRRHFFY